VKKKLRTASVV